jgi:methionyl-tRNA formyltransferase
LHVNQEGKAEVALNLKVLKTRLGPSQGSVGDIAVTKDAIVVTCGDAQTLEITQVQPPGKKAMEVKSYANGLRGKTLHILPQTNAALISS